MNNTGTTNHFYNDRLRLIGIFSLGRRYVAVSIINILLLLSEYTFGQCPGNNFFREQAAAVLNSTQKKADAKLTELLQLQRQMKACQLENDSAFMFILQKIGELYSRQPNYPAAINFTNESIHAARKCIVNHSCNPQALAANYYNLFYYYDKSGLLEKKYDAIDSCISYVLKGSSGFNVLIAPLADKAEYLFDRGEYSLCNKYAKLGEDIVQKYYHSKDSIIYIAFFVNLRANALYFSKNISAAQTLLESKITQFKQAGVNNELYLYASYGVLGLIYRYNKNYTQALSYSRQGYLASSSLKFRKGCAENLLNMGILYAIHFKKYATGLAYCDRALKYANAEDSLNILGAKGNIYVSKQMYDTAQLFFQQAFNTVRRGMNETTMLQNSFLFPRYNLLQDLSDLTIDKGDAYLRQYYHTQNGEFLGKALATYKKADLFLAKIKTEQHLQVSSSLIWSTYAHRLYEHAIEACYVNNNIEDAFYFFEKSRAVLLNDQISDQHWMADSDILKQAGLRKSITELERELSAVTTSSKEYVIIQNKLNSIYPEVDKLTRNIKGKNPLFYQNYLDTVFITVRQLQKNLLNGSKTLEEIFSGDSAVYVLSISPIDKYLFKINKQLYDSLTNSFNSFVGRQEGENRHFTEFVKTSNKLYRLIFQNKQLPPGSIIISPDGRNFPFEALIMNDSGEQPDYLLYHYATSYTYSAKYLTNQFTATPGTANNVLGIAPVDYKSYSNLSALSGSDQSLKNINNYFGNVTNYVFDKATKNNFLQNFPRYSILQLYTHAADNINNNDPVIYFADSTLYLSELLPERKPVTQLVILSACETATGKLYEGEGIFSFNRGFAALGIPAAISNLWSVDNESTYRITELFYKYLSQGLPTDIALQKAKIAFINNNSSSEKKMPYFWAGSILTGKVSYFKANKRSGFPWYGLIGATILVLGLIYFISKRFT